MKYTLHNKEIELTDEEVQEIVKQNAEPKEEKKVGIEIKNRWTGDIIFTSTKTTYKEAVEEAVAQEADLQEANLQEANLQEANLQGADLQGADLQEADLREADLREADLREADLQGADLRGADLQGADLQEANLREANLREADLMNTKFYGKGGTKTLTQEQVPVFLEALGFKIK